MSIKNLFPKAVFVLMLAMVLSTVGSVTHYADATAVTVNICHKDGGSGNWNALTLPEAAVAAHVPGHDGDYLATELGIQETFDDNWCAHNVPPTPVDACPNEQTDPGQQNHGPCNADDVCPNDIGIQLSLDDCSNPPQEVNAANIHFTKIVCDKESDLPNWGENTPDITSTTATTYINGVEGNQYHPAHPNCHLEPGWQFQTAFRGPNNLDNIVDPGGASTGEAGAPWSTVEGVTDANGTVTTQIDVTNIWHFFVREVLKDGYVPFSATNPDGLPGSDVSAEIYCSTDGQNYDNYEMFSPVAGQDYYCVAFNAPKNDGQDSCENDVTISNVVSDATTTFTGDDGAGNASLLSFIHPGWTANVGSILAKWIWSTDPVTDATTNDNEIFTKTFTITGTPTAATLNIAADNYYTAKVNGVTVSSDQVNGNTFAGAVSVNVLPQLVAGLNTITVEGTNLAVADSTPDANPAGIIFNLDLTQNACVPPPPTVCTDPEANNINHPLPCTYDEVNPPSADLSITKTVNDNTPDAGQTITYTITVTNNGTDSATSVVVNDVLPGGLVLGTATPSVGSFSAPTWTVGTLANGASATLTITATVGAETFGQTITNTATTSSAVTDPTPGNNSSTIDVTVNTNDGGSGNTNTEETVVVKSADLAADVAGIISDPTKWYFYNDTNDTVNNVLGAFTTGPSGQPLGTGSAKFVPLADGTSRTVLATSQYGGTLLSKITALSFYEYTPSGAWSLTEAPFFRFNVDFTGSGLYQKSLVFVPASVTQDVWQNVDMINGGSAMWLYSGAFWPVGIGELGTTPGTTPKSWSTILTTYPGISMSSTFRFMGVRAGEPGPTGFTANVDKFVMGVTTGSNTDTKTYDFEPTPAPTITSSGGGGGGGGGGGFLRSAFSAPQAPGQVLGAQDTACNWDINTYMRKGRKNNPAEVKILQRDLLNGYMHLNLKEDGMYGAKTEAGVKAFQISHKDKILTPWKLTIPTGIFYKTTLVEAKNTICPEVILPIPTDLIPWSLNPEVKNQ